MKQLLFWSEKTVTPAKNNSQRVRKLVINALRNSFGDKVSNLILVILANGGCVTTQDSLEWAKVYHLKKAMLNLVFANDLEQPMG